MVLDKALKIIDPTFVGGEKLSNDTVTNIGLNVIKTTPIKPNSADKEGIKKVVSLVKQGESLLVFPEGRRSRVGSLMEAKKDIILIARMIGVDIIPVGLYFTEKLLPINGDGNMSAESFNNADVHVHIGKRLKCQEKKRTRYNRL